MPTNAERAAVAAEIVGLYARIRDRVPNLIEGEHLEYAQDALTDILHLLHQHGDDAEATLQSALEDFWAEVRDEEGSEP